MTDAMNTPLHDDDLLAEIELTSELIILATESSGPVSQHSIDEVLRVDPSDDPSHLSSNNPSNAS